MSTSRTQYLIIEQIWRHIVEDNFVNISNVWGELRAHELVPVHPCATERLIVGQRISGMTLADSEADLPATPHYRPGTTDGETSKIVINELLAYCTYHMNNSSAETLKKVVLKFYHPDEIITASNVLSQECPTVAGSVVRHRNTPAREAHVAHAHDIIKALAKIDCSDEVFPLFVAAKIDRIPRYSPEEIDLTSVVERLNDLERKFGVLDGTVVA